MALATILYLMVSWTLAYASPEWCNSTYDEELERVIADAMRGVQEVYVSEMEPDGPGPSPLGFEGYRILGLGRMQRHGSLRTLCENDTQAVSFDLIAEEPVVCRFLRSGDTLEISAPDVKLTTHLRFVAVPRNDSSAETDRRILEYDEPVVTSMSTGLVTVNTGDTSDAPTGNTTVGLLRHLALASIQDSWEDQFVSKLARLLKRI